MKTGVTVHAHAGILVTFLQLTSLQTCTSPTKQFQGIVHQCVPSSVRTAMCRMRMDAQPAVAVSYQYQPLIS